MHEVGERLLPVDEDDWDALAVAGLELGIAGDVDVLELEGQFGAHLLEHAVRAFAQVAARGRVERDAARRYG
jgi:hypothetical protein